MLFSDKDVQVQFWDIDGGENQIALECCLRAHAVIVVYDITNRSSFQKSQYFLESINPRISALLIANKLDLQDYRKVTYSEGRLLAKIHRVQYIEASCKLNYNVEQALQLLLASIPKEYMRKRTPRIQARSYSENTVNNVPTRECSCVTCHRQLMRHKYKKDEIEIWVLFFSLGFCGTCFDVFMIFLLNLLLLCRNWQIYLVHV